MHRRCRGRRKAVRDQLSPKIAPVLGIQSSPTSWPRAAGQGRAWEELAPQPPAPEMVYRLLARPTRTRATPIPTATVSSATSTTGPGGVWRRRAPLDTKRTAHERDMPRRSMDVRTCVSRLLRLRSQPAVAYAPRVNLPFNGRKARMRTLKQAWWAPLAGVLAISQLSVALAFIFGEGTSNLLDAESTAAGISLSLPGAVALAVGLWTRPRGRGLGNALVIAGAALAAIWVWIVFMTPMAIAVIVGVLISQVRSTAPTVGTP